MPRRFPLILVLLVTAAITAAAWSATSMIKEIDEGAYPLQGASRAQSSAIRVLRPDPTHPSAGAALSADPSPDGGRTSNGDSAAVSRTATAAAERTAPRAPSGQEPAAPSAPRTQVEAPEGDSSRASASHTATDYLFPVEEVAGFLSANFGEMRPGHFHSGVDIKTDGVEGKNVVAAADGEIVRMVISPTGYGRALYVAHPDGTTTVYGHLSRFRDDIERYAREERYRLRRNRVDLYPAAGSFPVRQGERIALSGNSGTSYGPHLHYEIRDAEQRPLNPVRLGAVRAADDLPPLIAALHYIEIDTLDGVPVHSAPRTLPIKRLRAGSYALASPTPLAAGRRGYLLLECSDRKNDVTNTFGIYRVRMEVDGQAVYEYRMDGYRFDQTRYCNAVSYYPKQLSSRNEVIRLVQLSAAPRHFYPVATNSGLLTPAANQRQRVRIEVEDDSGNLSTLTFELTGCEDAACFRAERSDPHAPLIDPARPFSRQLEQFRFECPAGALYEAVFFSWEAETAPIPSDSSLIVLSPQYTILSSDIPMHKSGSLAIKAYVPKELQPHTALATINRKGKPVYAGGRYRNGEIAGSISSLGSYLVVADTVAPRLSARFADGEDLQRASGFSFRASDDFSGIAEYRAEIDGQWVPLDRDPIRGTIRHTFDDRHPAEGRRRHLRVTLSDNCGNRTLWEGSFIR